MKGAQCDKNHPERQQEMNFQQGFSCRFYIVPFSQLWVRASRYWRLQLLSRDTGHPTWHIPLQVRWMLPSRGTLVFQSRLLPVWRWLLDCTPEDTLSITDPEEDRHPCGMATMQRDTQTHDLQVCRASMNLGPSLLCPSWYMWCR